MYHLRISIAVFSMLLVSIVAEENFADITVTSSGEIRHAVNSPANQGTVYKLEITPAAEASPAFEHRFTVPPHETKPGNAITHYLRGLGERGLSRPWDYAVEETDFAVQDWYSAKTPASEIPLDKLRTVSEAFDGLVSHIRLATYCRDSDWGIAVEDLKGVDMVAFLLPSVQETRSMARAVLLQNRLAVIEKRYDDSIERIRMAYQIGRNANEMGFLVTHLVGIAETKMANDAVMLLIASEHSPNLYWALAELEIPSARRSLRLDSSMPLRVFPELMDIENANYSKSEWKRLLKKYSGEIGTISSLTGSGTAAVPGNEFSDVIALSAGLAGYSKAKKRMEQRGIAKESIEQMGVSELILRDAAHDIKYFANALETSYYLPREQGIRRAKEWKNMINRESRSRIGAMITSYLSPASTQVLDAGYRAKAEIHVLMAIESLRNHAAIHGTFPKSLEELNLPVRNNPFTEKPFNYLLDGSKAVLSYEQGSSGIQRYEITIKN